MTAQEWLVRAVGVLRHYATMPHVTMEGQIGVLQVNAGWSPDAAREFLAEWDAAIVDAPAGTQERDDA